jgi:hypothetical protein
MKMRTGLIACTLLSLTAAAPAFAEQTTAEALQKFGWEGTWSVDCSVPSTITSGNHQPAVLARLHDVVPMFSGSPARTVELTINGAPANQVFIVTNARMVADNKLLTISTTKTALMTMTYESVLTMTGGKMVGLRGRVTGVAKQDIQAGRYSTDALKAGDHFEYNNAENGVALNFKGEPIGVAASEKCRD